MRILLTNDDGYLARGLKAVRDELRKAGEVTVVAPEREQSGVSSSLTLYQPILVREHDFDGVRTISVAGTPADAVKLALTEFLDEPPHLVVSGINFGLNTGPNILYSGTCAGALEAAQAGLTSVAISLQVSKDPEWPMAAKLGAKIALGIVEAHPQSATVFNVNIPALPAAKIRGTLVTRQEPTPWIDTFERRLDPRGRTYFWLKGREPRAKRPRDGEAPTDAHAIQEGYISVTPVHRDLTAEDLLGDLAAELERKATPAPSRGPRRA
jgi:5'-nucleotidase